MVLISTFSMKDPFLRASPQIQATRVTEGETCHCGPYVRKYTPCLIFKMCYLSIFHTSSQNHLLHDAALSIQPIRCHFPVACEKA